MTSGGDRDRRDRQRRLLVISFHFPPDGSVGGQRWGGISKYLARRGWNVHVITAAAQRGESPPGVHVHHCARRRTLNDVYNSWMPRLRSRRAVSSANGSSAHAIRAPGGVSWLRSNLGASLGFPDHGRGWILRAAETASALLREQRFDGVVSSGPPHSAHVAAVFASAGGQAPLWIDMRDPWAALVNTAWLQGLYGSALMKTLIPLLERYVFARADRIVANTAPFADELRRSNPALRVSYVPNGIDLERLPPAAQRSAKFDGFSIAYAGSLYAGRDLGVVLAALHRFLEAHPDARGKVKLRVAGRTEAQHEARFWSDVDAAGVRDVVEFQGEVASAHALDMVNRSHLALVLAQDQAMQVPAKLYECVGLRVPTMVIAEPASAAAGEARRVGAVACAPDDVEGVRRLIEQLWREPASANGTATLADISYASIAARVEDLLLRDITAHERSVAR